ncbi:hypothetical protein B0T18DRAFT_316660, partial [Schizothecium vesticola]
KRQKTYNTRDSLVVTDPTTSLAVAGLSMGERTGSRIFQCLWSYVSVGGERASLVVPASLAPEVRPILSADKHKPRNLTNSTQLVLINLIFMPAMGINSHIRCVKVSYMKQPSPAYPGTSKSTASQHAAQPDICHGNPSTARICTDRHPILRLPNPPSDFQRVIK